MPKPIVLRNGLAVAGFAVVLAAASAAQAQTWSAANSSLYNNPSSAKVGVGNAIPAAQLDVANTNQGRVALRVNQTIANNNIAEFRQNGTTKVFINYAGVLQADSGVKIKSWSMEVPDYVFDETKFKLRPLEDLDRYVKANKHLPEVPSARELEAEGMDLAKTNLLLLKKVEELTLYLIQQDKKIKELSAQVAEARK